MSEQETRTYESKSSSRFNGWLESYGSLDEPKKAIREDLTMTLVDLAMLSLLDSVPMTGYALRKMLVSQFGLKTSYGTLYPRLKSLEKSGIIKYSDNIRLFSARKSGISYELTPNGKQVFAFNLRLFQEFLKRVQFRL
jgi:DNA-binding PadR family transcriptional regulator